MRYLRRDFLASAVAFAALPAAARAADLPVVNVGTIPTDVSAVVNYALDLGYFKDAGLDVRLTTLTSGPVVANAVAGGSLDVGAANVGSLTVARSRGVPLRVFAPAGMADSAATGDIIAVLKDAPIQSAADLNGKTIGIVAVKTMQHAAVLLWIDRDGGDSKTVKFVEIPFPEMYVALQGHRVDAVLPDEPFTTMMRANVRSLGNQWSAMHEPFLIFGFFSTEQWLAAHPDLAAKFSSAILRAAKWANGHRKDSAEILVRYTKVDPAIASTMGRSTYGTALEASMIQPIVENLVRYGMLEKPVDANDLIWRPK
jgi:NitT/TauT family transport system substrate-binding protein